MEILKNVKKIQNIYVFDTITKGIFNWFFIIFILKKLDTENFAIFSIILLIVLFQVSINNLSSSYYILNKYSLQKKIYKTYLNNLVIFTIILSVFNYIFFLLIFYFFSAVYFNLYLLLGIINLTAIMPLIENYYIAQKKVNYVFVRLIYNLISVLIVIFYYNFYNINYSIEIFVFSQVLYSFNILFLPLKSINFRIRLKYLKLIFLNNFWIIVNSFSSFLIHRSDLFILTTFSSPVSVSVYALILRAADNVNQLLNSFSRGFISDFIKKSQKTFKLTNFDPLLTKIVFFIILLFSAFLFFYGDFFLNLLLKVENINSNLYYFLIPLVVLMKVVILMYGQILILKKKFFKNFIYGLVGFFIHVILAIILIPTLDLDAVVLSSFIMWIFILYRSHMLIKVINI